jgi:hypothetical protein
MRTIEDLRRHLSRGTVEDDWLSIEDEHGDLDRIDDKELKDLLRGQLRIADILGRQGISVPAIVFPRILEAVIDQLRRAARAADDKRKIVECSKMLKRFRATLPRRPRNRPRHDYAQRVAQEQAVREFEDRRLQLMRHDRLAGNAAIVQAAQDVAPCYDVRPATIVSWWAHPERRPHVRRWRAAQERRRRAK